MCGIAGLFLKDPSLEGSLGSTLAGMLAILADRGPDSTGFAIYGGEAAGRCKLTVRLSPGVDANSVAAKLGGGAEIVVHDDHVVISVAAEDEERALGLLLAEPGVALAGRGRCMELYKGVGMPEAVAARFGLAGMGGTHAIGHTRMATESAVTIAGAHPFSTGADQCLVHNGSLSNHNSIRRALAREGFAMETANDSEVAAGYLSWRMSRGASLGEALDAALNDLDGFYTFVVGTKDGFGVLRDPIACKPAVMAETDRYVAFGSEYRALADLPGIEGATLFEPEPGRTYFWSRA